MKARGSAACTWDLEESRRLEHVSHDQCRRLTQCVLAGL